MHLSSFDNMKHFRSKYLEALTDKSLSIYDLGSCDINGSYKPLFDNDKWSYKGVDMQPGKNVDIVLKDPNHWKDIKSGSVDVLVSGQAFEHMEYFWVVMLEIRRILRPGGLCCLIAPSSGHEHRFPVDCYRFFPDGFRALAKFASIDEIESYYTKEEGRYVDGSEVWKDCVFIGRKPQKSFWVEKMINIRHMLLRKLMLRN